MSIAGSITSLVSPFVAVQIASFTGQPPEGEAQFNRFQRSGVDGQDYQDGGDHGVEGQIQIGIDHDSAAARETVYNQLLDMRGDNVTLVLGPDTYPGKIWKLLNIVGAPDRQTMALAAGGVTAGPYFQTVALKLERVL